VWTSQSGQLTSPPLQSSQVAARTELDEALAVPVLASTLIVIGWLVRWVLDRRRLAAWDAGWLANGRGWSRRP
jgi:hypothetical protein